MDTISMDNALSYLSESLVDRVVQMEDVGWRKIFGSPDDDEGMDLDTLKNISAQLRELTATHPLFTRGDHLRGSYVFGRGMTFIGTDKPRYREIIDRPQNQAAIFGVEAHEIANRALFTDGLFCVIRNVKTNQFIQVPLTQLSGIVTNPDDTSDWWYIERSWNANNTTYQSLIPIARHFNREPASFVVDGSGQRKPVNTDYRAYVKIANRHAGWLLGVPDSLPALIYALAYSGYLKDQATLVHALSKFAWNLTSDSTRKTEKIKTRVELVGGDNSVGNASIGANVSSVGVPSAQVNFNNGQPLAALVAASFGVPVIALLSSPGATGGSYGAAETLDAPTLKGFEVVQNSWAGFFTEILRDLGAKDASVGFSSIESDPSYRQVSSIAQAYELGLIWADEAREAIIDILDVPVKHDTATKPPLLATTTTISSQGNSADGVNKSTTNPQGDTNNDAAKEK